MQEQKASPASADEPSRNRWFAATQRDEACHLLTFEAEELPPRPGVWLVKPVEEEVSGRRSGMHLSSQLGLLGVNRKMTLVGAVELSWPMERCCLRQEGSSCAPLKREEQKTQKAKSHQNNCTPPPVSFGDLQKRYHRKSR